MRARLELVEAVVAAVGCVLSWLAASSTVVGDEKVDEVLRWSV